MSAVTAILLLTAAGKLSTKPPIIQIIPILRATLGLLRTFLSQALRVVVAFTTSFFIFASLISCLPVPVLLVFRNVLDAAVYTSYKFISSVAAALFPLSNKIIAPELPKATESLQDSELSMRPRKRSSFTEDS
ncbi:hypothetical protein BDR03DRAFT_939516 [Suillus americanus]|nr:hypothetical protein BDR03DRAFT_939516 [Suillus americanus]